MDIGYSFEGRIVHCFFEELSLLEPPDPTESLSTRCLIASIFTVFHLASILSATLISSPYRYDLGLILKFHSLHSPFKALRNISSTLSKAALST